ncbi:MAG: GNAT family N-acetyltransferase [Cyanobacteria bacterium P01_D01_bin.116]
MSKTNISIRDAQKKDVSSIMELIYLKAEFDGCPESIQATPEKLEADLFGKQPLAFVLLAEIDEHTIGFATYHFIYSTFLTKPGIWLDDLYVKATYRNLKIGELLIQYLCQIAQAKGCARIDWTVAISNERGIKFYERMSAKIRQQVRLCRLDNQAISHNASLINFSK